MNENAYASAVERLGEREPVVCNEAAVAAARLAERLLGTSAPPADRDAAMASFDDDLDAVLAPTTALVALGSETGLRSAAATVAAIAEAASGRHQPHVPLAAAVLARTLLVLTAAALAWDRPDALARMAAITRSDGRGHR